MKAIRLSLAIGSLLITTGAWSAPPASDVGDPDSFGRGVKYLGSAGTPQVLLQSDCTPSANNPIDPGSRCVLLAAQPSSTAYDESSLASIKLPANASRSLLCFTVTPVTTYGFNNATDAKRYTRFSVRATYTIQSDVFNDPTLINPNTNTPLAGKISGSMTLLSRSFALPAGDQTNDYQSFSRSCIGGLISKQMLQDAYGLTAAQAAAVFAKPITLSFGTAGNTQLLSYAVVSYGVRIYGD
jgi:hypothetical protein